MKQVKWICPFCATEKKDMKLVDKDYLPSCGQKCRADIPKRIWKERYKCKCGMVLTNFNLRKIETFDFKIG